MTVVVQIGDAVVAVSKEFNSLVSALNVASGFSVKVPKSGVVRVGDDDADVVIEAVVIPIKVVVITESMSGDESAVKVV